MAWPALATAQAWPDRPVRILLGYGPGGAVDAIARVLQPRMASVLGVPVVIEHKPGAAGAIAMEATARAQPDGLTLHLADSSPLTILPNLRKVPYDPVTSFTHVGTVAGAGLVLLVHPSLGVQTLPEFLAVVRQAKEPLAYGSSGLGSLGHLAAELFQSTTGTRMSHVPYKGGAASMNDLLGGQIRILFGSPVPAIPHVAAGAIRALAVTSGHRIAAYPTVPTVAELGLPGAQTGAWLGMLAPANTPPARVQRIREAMVAALEDPANLEVFRSLAYVVDHRPPQQMTRLVQDELALWAKVVAERGIRIEA